MGGDLGWYDIEVTWSQASDRLVDDTDLVGMQLPVAALFAGDLVCLGYRSHPDRPAAVMWDHEGSEQSAPAVVPIAGSFADFVELLREG